MQFRFALTKKNVIMKQLSSYPKKVFCVFYIPIVLFEINTDFIHFFICTCYLMLQSLDVTFFIHL